MSANAGSATQPAGIFADIDNPDTVADFKGLAELESKAVQNCKSLESLQYILDPKAWHRFVLPLLTTQRLRAMSSKIPKSMDANFT